MSIELANEPQQSIRVDRWTQSRRVAIESMGVSFTDRVRKLIAAGEKQFKADDPDAEKQEHSATFNFGYQGIESDAMCAAFLCESNDDTVSRVQVDGITGRNAANAWYEEFIGGDISRVSIVTSAWAKILSDCLATAALLDDAPIEDNGEEGDDAGLGEF